MIKHEKFAMLYETRYYMLQMVCFGCIDEIVSFPYLSGF